MKSLHEHTTNRFFYFLGLAVFFPAATLCILQNSGHLNLTTLLSPCFFRRVSGLYCPGCGGTRAVQALLERQFLMSFICHPFVPYCAVLYVVFMISHTLELIFSCKWFAHMRKKSSPEKSIVRGLHFRIRYVYIGIIIILLQWMLKNLFLISNSS